MLGLDQVRVDLELEGKQVIAAEALPTDKFSNRRCQVFNCLVHCQESFSLCCCSVSAFCRVVLVISSKEMGLATCLNLHVLRSIYMDRIHVDTHSPEP